MSIFYYLRGSFKIRKINTELTYSRYELTKNSITLINKYDLYKFKSSTINENQFWNDIQKKIPYSNMGVVVDVSNPIKYLKNMVYYDVDYLRRCSDDNYLYICKTFKQNEREDIDKFNKINVYDIIINVDQDKNNFEYSFINKMSLLG